MNKYMVTCNNGNVIQVNADRCVISGDSVDFFYTNDDGEEVKYHTIECVCEVDVGEESP